MKKLLLMAAALCVFTGVYAKKVKFQVDMTGPLVLMVFISLVIFKKMLVPQIIGNLAQLQCLMVEVETFTQL